MKFLLVFFERVQIQFSWMIAQKVWSVCLINPSNQGSSVLIYPSLLWNAGKNSISDNILYHNQQIINYQENHNLDVSLQHNNIKIKIYNIYKYIIS